jgi:hypothetical protein
MAFPIAIGWDASAGHGVGFYIHFFLSLALCGVAATTYPYMLITAISIHYFIPALVRRGVIPGPKREDLAEVARMTRLYLYTSILVPMLGILMMSVFRSDDAAASAKWALIAVSAGGGLGFLAMILLERLIALDVDALSHVAIDDRRGRGGHSSGHHSSDRRQGSQRRDR